MIYRGFEISILEDIALIEDLLNARLVQTKSFISEATQCWRIQGDIEQAKKFIDERLACPK